MAKLKDLVNVNINRDTITVQGASIPVIFTMQSFPFIEEAYGKGYHIFEKDMNRLLLSGEFTLGTVETKIMHALIYGMVRSGGTECTPAELAGAIPLSDLPDIFEKVLGIFQNQIFQASDEAKLSGAAKGKKKQK